MSEPKVYTTAIIAAVPTQDDPVHQVVAEDAHVTLQFLGEAADLTDEQITEIKQTLAMLASVVYPFDADISGTAELGPDKAQVLIVQSALLTKIREMLGMTDAVSTAVAASEQFPNWIPHLTLAYEGEMPDVDGFSSVQIGSVELWLGSEAKHVYELSQPKPLAAAGVHEFEEGLHPRGADGRFIEKFGIIKFLTGHGWQYGKVEGIYHDKASGAVKLTVTPSDLSGKTSGASIELTPKQVYKAPAPKAHLLTNAVGVKKIGGQAGSNQGGLYEIPKQKNIGTTTGFPVMEGVEQFYVKKPKTKSHGNNEALANALYEEAGVPVPEVDYASDGNLYSKIVKGQQDMASQLNNAEWTDQVRRNFAVDAWLGNRDVFGMTYDNILTDEHGVPWRIDNGGALLYRAMGEKKTDFGSKVTELDAFRTGKKAKIFGPGMTKAQELDGAERVLAISPGQIDDMVKDHGLPQSLADTLKARRAYIASYYGLELPESKQPAEAEGPTSAPLVDAPDIAGNKGKTRNWFKTTLAHLGFFAQSGDHVELPDGSTQIMGKDDDGQPLSIVGMQAQVLGWTTQYQPDAEIFLRKFTSVGKPRPEHGSKLQGSDLSAQQWKRGDEIISADGEIFRVKGWNSDTGAMLIQSGDGPEQLLDTKGKDSTGVWTVNRWDPPAVDTTPIQTEEQATSALGDFLAQAEATPHPIQTLEQAPGHEEGGFTPQSEMVQNMIAEDVTGELEHLTAPQPGKTGQAAVAEANIKADLDQPLPSGNGQPAPPKTSAPGGAKTMVLGDGTEAATGDAVQSKKDGKTYTFVKPKGQYAVVTDPNGEDPSKQLLKLASTMFQPGKQPAGDVEIEKPKTATGEVPALGMMAVAKDGWAGEITLISPDGKFVFITDANGKRKRKSTGTVSVTSSPSPIGGGDKPTGDPANNTPPPDVPKPSTVPGPLKDYGPGPANVPAAKAALGDLSFDLDDPADLDAGDMVVVGYADGSVGLEPWNGQPLDSLLTNTTGKVATHNTIVTFKGTVESGQLVKAAAVKNNDYNWDVVWNGHIMVTNGQAGPNGGLMLWDYDEPGSYALEIPTGQNVTLLSGMKAEESIPGILPDPTGISSAQFLTPDTGFFAPVAPLYGDEAKTLADWKADGVLAVGSEISLDGKNWLEVQHVFSAGGLYAKDDNGVVANIPSGSKATWVIKAPALADGDAPNPAFSQQNAPALPVEDLPVDTGKKKIEDLVQGDVVTDGNGNVTIIDSVTAVGVPNEVTIKAMDEEWGSPANPNFEMEFHGNLNEAPTYVPLGKVAPHLYPGAQIQLSDSQTVQVATYPEMLGEGAGYKLAVFPVDNPGEPFLITIGPWESGAEISEDLAKPVHLGGFVTWQEAGADKAKLDALFDQAKVQPQTAVDHHAQMTDAGIPFGTAAYPIYFNEPSGTYFRQGPTGSLQEWDDTAGAWNNVFGGVEDKTKVWDGVPFEGELAIPSGFPDKVMADIHGNAITYKPKPGETIQAAKVDIGGSEQTVLIAYPSGLDGPAHVIMGSTLTEDPKASATPFQDGWKESGTFTDLTTIHDPFADAPVDTVPHQQGAQPPAEVGQKLQQLGYTPKPGETLWVSKIEGTTTMSLLSKQEDGTYFRIKAGGVLAVAKAWTPEQLKNFDQPGVTVEHYTWTYVPEGASGGVTVQGLPAGFEPYVPGDGQSVLKVTLPNGKQNVYVQKQPEAGWYEMGPDGVVLENSDAVKSNFVVQQKLAGKGSQAAKYELLWPQPEGHKDSPQDPVPTFANYNGTWTPDPHQSVVALTSSSDDPDPWFFVQDTPGGPWVASPNSPHTGTGQIDDGDMQAKIKANPDMPSGYKLVYSGQTGQAAVDAPNQELPPTFHQHTPVEGTKVYQEAAANASDGQHDIWAQQVPGGKFYFVKPDGGYSQGGLTQEEMDADGGMVQVWPAPGAGTPEAAPAAQSFGGYTPEAGDKIVSADIFNNGQTTFLVQKAGTTDYKLVKTDGTINPHGGATQTQIDGQQIPNQQVWPPAGQAQQAGVFGGYQTAPGDAVVQLEGNGTFYVKQDGQTVWKKVLPDGTLSAPEDGYSQGTMEWAAGEYGIQELQGTLKPGAPVTPDALPTSVAPYAGVTEETNLNTTVYTFGTYNPSQEQWKRLGKIGKLNPGMSVYVLEDSTGSIESSAVLMRNSVGNWFTVLPDGSTSPMFTNDEETENWIKGNAYVLHKAKFQAPTSAPAPVSTGPKAQLSGWQHLGLPNPESFNYLSDPTQGKNAKAGDYVFVQSGSAGASGGGLVAQLDKDWDGTGAFTASKVAAVDAGGVIGSQTAWIPAAEGESFPFTVWNDQNSYYIAAQLAPSTAPVAAPAAPAAPAPVSTYPGQHKPSQEDINSWGGDLTKDGHIPTPGMFVTGKGPMSGKVVSVSKDKTKATVLKADGTKTTRLISALKTDAATNYQTYAMPASSKVPVPSGMALAVDTPDEALAKTLQDGKFRAIVSDHAGVLNGEMTVTAATAPSGKKFNRVHLTLTDAQREQLVAMLSGSGEKGDWVASSKQSQQVAIGDKIPMRQSSTNNPDGTPRWKVDSSIVPPTHEVIGVTDEAGGTGVKIVTLKNVNTGEEITSRFHPGKSLATYTWDPNKPKKITGTGFSLSEMAKAQGWSMQNDGVISAVNQDGKLDVEPGKAVSGSSSMWAGGGGMNSTWQGLRNVTSDGVVIEITDPKGPNSHSNSGFTTISVPEGMGAEALNGALAKMGIDYSPMTQDGAKKHVRGLLRNLMDFDSQDVESAKHYTDEALFTKAGQAIGLSDLGWQDVLVGVDESTGKVSYFWSTRVQTALGNKAKHNLIYRAAASGDANAIVSTVKYGTANAILKRATGMIYAPSGKGIGASPGSDNSHHAGHGGFASATNAAKLPTGNSQASYKGSNMMVYMRPEAVLGRIMDYRVSKSDAFGGGEGKGSNSLANASSWSGVKDYFLGGGLPSEAISFIAVSNAGARSAALQKLHSEGISQINGRPIEEIVILQSDAGKYSPKDLPVVVPPANARPILDLPTSYDAPAGPAGAVTADASEAAA